MSIYVYIHMFGTVCIIHTDTEGKGEKETENINTE